MMRLRMTSDNQEFKKYDLDSNFDSALIEKKMRRGQEDRYGKREEKRQNQEYRRN